MPVNRNFAACHRAPPAGNPLRDLAGGLIAPGNLEDLMYRVTCRRSCFKIASTMGFVPAMKGPCPGDPVVPKAFFSQALLYYNRMSILRRVATDSLASPDEAARRGRDPGGPGKTAGVA